MPRDRAPPLFPEFDDAAGIGAPDPSATIEDRSSLDGAPAQSTGSPLPDSLPLSVSPVPLVASPTGDSASDAAIPAPSRDFNRERTKGMARNHSPPTITKLV